MGQRREDVANKSSSWKLGHQHHPCNHRTSIPKGRYKIPGHVAELDTGRSSEPNY